MKRKTSKNRCNNWQPRRKGMYLPIILVAGTLFLAFAVTLITYSISNIKIAGLHNKKITAMAISEAGINYYMWHLSHFNQDYCDGKQEGVDPLCPATVPNGGYGPFHHNYTGTAGQGIGTYDLYITPPQAGSMVVTIKSIGKVNGISPTQTIVAEVGMTPFSKYTLLVNGSELHVKSGETITGSAFVNNNGLYNEGTITGDAYSTEDTYNSSGWGQQPGIAGSVGAVFGGAKLMPTTPVDYEGGVGGAISSLYKSACQLHDSGTLCVGPSNQNGYHLILDGNNYSLQKIKKYDSKLLTITTYVPGSQVVGTLTDTNVIVVDDDLWVEGNVNRAVTIVATKDPSRNNDPNKKIVIPNLLGYTNNDYSGISKLGLISDTDILLANSVPNVMKIDAAMIAANGSIKVPCDQPSNCTFGQKTSITVTGSMGVNDNSSSTGFKWKLDKGGGLWSGFDTYHLAEDPHNILNPPPGFPQTGSYSILSWREE